MQCNAARLSHRPVSRHLPCVHPAGGACAPSPRDRSRHLLDLANRRGRTADTRGPRGGRPDIQLLPVAADDRAQSPRGGTAAITLWIRSSAPSLPEPGGTGSPRAPPRTVLVRRGHHVLGEDGETWRHPCARTPQRNRSDGGARHRLVQPRGRPALDLEHDGPWTRRVLQRRARTATAQAPRGDLRRGRQRLRAQPAPRARSTPSITRRST